MGLRSNLQIWRGPAALASDAAARRGRSHWRSLAGVLVAWIVLGTVWEVGARMGITASMSLATVAALGGVPGEYIKSARSLGSKGWRLWLRVILPAAAPGVATAIRLSFFAAWMSVLAGEMAGINSGLGSLVILGQ